MEGSWVADRGRGLGVAEGPEQRDRLRCGEGEVEAGDGALAPGDPAASDQRLVGGGVVAGEHRAQLIAHDVALESELGGSVAGPAPRRLALAGVVVLGAVGDLLQVVALLARSQLSDREHPPSLSRERAICVISPAAVILREGRRRWGKRGAAGVQPRLLKSARPGSERLLGAGGLVPGGGSLPVTTQRRDREARCRHRRPIRGPAAQHV